MDFCFSDRKMEGDEGLRTLECLRGRLLAERQASRVAEEDSEFMGKKVILVTSYSSQFYLLS